MNHTVKSFLIRVLAIMLCLVVSVGAMVEFYTGVSSNGNASATPNNPPSSPTTPDVESGGNQPEGDADHIFSASTNLATNALIYGSLASGVTIGDGGIGATIPADVKIENGASSLALSVKAVETGSEITLGEGETAQSLDVHIDGIAADNTVPMIVNLGAVFAAGLGETGLKLYHVENGTPVLMTKVSGVENFAIHNQYTYNNETGEVSIYVASFSVFSAVQASVDTWDGEAVAEGFASGTGTEDDPFIIETAAQLVYFRNQVDAGVTYDDQYVKLAKDIDLADKLFDPIGFGYYDDDDTDGKTNYRVFMGTFDGASHTIYNLYQNCWELDPDKTNYSTYTYSTAGAGLFASIKDATMKNIAISGAEIVFECVDMGVLVGYAQGTCHFENIVITNSNIANYNRYTGGVVGEVSHGPYGIDTSLDYSHTFKNVTVDSTVTVSGLWGSFGCGMGGVIGGKWGDATVMMENVVSAPVMDVYNDVTSAYQWYAFRGCGMLIGHTEEPYSDGRHSGNATASFLTCENVKVYYGDWVNYHYYEFKNQDNGTGRNYPWVRAEAGNYCDAFSNIRYGVPTHGGVKVSDLTAEELKAIATNYTPIVFDQLYGADRGMYGTAEHEGVTVFKSNKKTVYIQNNLGWTNLKLHYWYKNGNDIWTNVVNGIVLTEENGVYKVELPAYAFGFKLTADSDNETRDFYVSEVEENGTYNLDFEHVHNFIGNNCDCGATIQITDYEFTLGENGNASHVDGSDLDGSASYTTDGYTLNLTDMSKVYGPAFDAKGNSCIKLGTGSVAGRLTFTVPDDIIKVTIYVAKYKSNTSKIEVNGEQYTLTKNSDNGEYDEITIDTTTEKTVTLTTLSGGYRCMINTIVFFAGKTIEVHECNENVIIEGKDANCTETGFTEGAQCDICGKTTKEQTSIPATNHNYESVVTPPTCTEDGYTTHTCSICKDNYKDTPVSASGHNYVNNICTVCGALENYKTLEYLEKLAGSELQIGDIIVFVYEDGKMELSGFHMSDYGTGTEYDSVPNATMKFEVVAGSTSGTVAFKNGEEYLCWNSGNSLNMDSELTENTSWIVSVDVNGNATVKNAKDNARVIRWNSSSPRFACYTTEQKSISIYVQRSKNICLECTAMQEIEKQNATCQSAGYVINQCTVCGNEEKTILEILNHNFDGSNPYICDYNCGVIRLPEANSVITIQQALWIAETLDKSKETAEKYTITGIITDDNDPSSTGATTIAVGEYSIYITNIHNTDGSIRHDAFITKLKNGDEITVSAKIAKNDSGDPQLKETWLTDHNLVVINAVAPSCTQTGLTAGEKCSICGKITIEQTEIPVTNHNYVGGVCVNCGEKEPVTIVVDFVVPNGIDAVEMGGGNMLPSANAPDGFAFAGWSVENIKDTTITPTLYKAGTEYTGDATTLYAVYTYTEVTEGENIFIKITESKTDWSGTYLIVYETGNVAFNGGLDKLDATSNTIAVTIQDETIEVSEELLKAIFVINANGNIQSASGYYIGQTSDANGLNSNKSTTYVNTITLNNDGTINIVSGGAYLRYNASVDQSRFRYYKSSSYTGQKAITLYELAKGGDKTITHYLTICDHENTTETTVDATCTEAGYTVTKCASCGEEISRVEGEAATGHSYNEEITTEASCTTTGSKTFKCSCGDSYTEEISAIGHTTDNGVCDNCGETIGGTTEPTVVLEITKDDFNSTSYAANNNTKAENGYSYTSYQVMNQSSTMQWQKSKGYITIASNVFVKLELKATAGTYTITVGGKTVTGTTSNGVTTYDLSGLTGEVKIAVGSATGKVDHIKFYK